MPNSKGQIFNSPATNSIPKAPPDILPASYAAFPIRMALVTSNKTISFEMPEEYLLTNASPNPWRVMKPILAAISWSMIVAITEKSKTHNKVYPDRTPAIVQVVIVPGPINAAVISVDGPKYLLSFISYILVLIAS